jgi:hypothetical protein
MHITKKGKELLESGEVSEKDFSEFLLKFAFMTSEQFTEWQTLPTKETRKAFIKNLPLPIPNRKK